jgi:DNA processing protein
MPDGSGVPLLIVEGRLPVVPGVAVVGARATDPYGTALARATAEAVVALGRAVVSGGAEGCDRAAHEATLEAGGATIVVLGSGHDHPYPTHHADLFRRVVEGGGAVVSPFWPECRPARHRFLTRNRVIARMAAATVVVRAREVSGALSTAREALRVGHPVLAVPGSVGSALSAGPHRLLAEGARVLGSPDDLARALGLGPLPAAIWPSDERGDPSPWRAGWPSLVEAAELSPAAIKVWEALENDGPLDLEGVVGQTGLPAAEVVANLLLLELAGQIEPIPGQRYATRRPRAA